MKINLNELSYKDKIEIDEVISYDADYLKDSPIQKLENVKLQGFLYQNNIDEYKCNLQASGTMILLDSVTLEEIPYDFNLIIDENLDEVIEKNQNMLDIIELLWQNIVLEVPIRYTQSDAENMKGNNWEVLNENSKEETIDPRMQKLYDYYKGGE